jgi:hypothetical protein
VIGPLLKLATDRPDLVVDHLLAYASLAKRQIDSTKSSVFRRVVASGVAVASGVSFLTLTGVALMLLISLPGSSFWALCAPPAATLLITIVALVVAASSGPLPEEKTVIAQLQADITELKRLSEFRA